MLTLDEAITAVTASVAPTKTPALTADEIAAIVEGTARMDLWQADTLYAFGDYIYPVTTNDRYYRCAVAGTSGASEPDWGSYITRYAAYSAYSYVLVTDNTVQWEDAGPFVGERYDVRRACHACWMRKAEKAANQFDVSISGKVSASREQVYRHCLEQALRFQPLGIY